jgi:hypothetical protein
MSMVQIAPIKETTITSTPTMIFPSDMGSSSPGRAVFYATRNLGTSKTTAFPVRRHPEAAERSEALEGDGLALCLSSFEARLRRAPQDDGSNDDGSKSIRHTATTP